VYDIEISVDLVKMTEDEHRYDRDTIAKSSVSVETDDLPTLRLALAGIGAITLKTFNDGIAAWVADQREAKSSHRGLVIEALRAIADAGKKDDIQRDPDSGEPLDSRDPRYVPTTDELVSEDTPQNAPWEPVAGDAGPSRG
jgi:hypothetical protein